MASVKVKFFCFDGLNVETAVNAFLEDKEFVFATENEDGLTIYYKEKTEG